MTALKDIEKEILTLKVAIWFVNSMVNYEMLNISLDCAEPFPIFKTRTHATYFNIILTDFLSSSNDKTFGLNESHLSCLENICIRPCLGNKKAISKLTLVIRSFKKWLDKEVLIEKIWLPTISKEFNLRIKRNEFIKICGNIEKHNFTHLTRKANDIKKICERNNIGLDDAEKFLILDEFHEWFFNILSYHSGTICEFLNNIRWGIQDYLQPEFRKAVVYYEVNKTRMYKYTYPKEITTAFIKNYYWELMNDIMCRPYITRFTISKTWKKRY